MVFQIKHYHNAKQLRDYFERHAFQFLSFSTAPDFSFTILLSRNIVAEACAGTVYSKIERTHRIDKENPFVGDMEG